MSEEALQIAEKRREAKGKGEKERYTHLNAEFQRIGAFLVAQTINHLPTMRETWVQFLGQDYSLEMGMATLCSILAWRMLWTEQPGRLQSMGLQRVGHNSATKHTHIII